MDTKKLIDRQEEKERIIAQTLQKRLRNTRRSLGVAVVMVVLALVAGVLAWNKNQEAESNLVIAREAQTETKKALTQAHRLIDAFYFYENELGLVYGENENYDLVSTKPHLVYIK